MRVVLSTFGSRGDVEPMVALAVGLRELGVEVRMSVPPDFAERVAGVGLPVVATGPSVREVSSGATAWKPADLPRHAAELMATQYDALTEAAEGADVLVATGMIPAVAAARAVAEKRGIHHVHVSFFPTMLPTPHRPPFPWPGQPSPPEATGNRELWEANARHLHALFGETVNTYRASVGLPPVDNVRDHVFTERPLLATDPALDPWWRTPDLDVVQTGAWILPDERPLPADLVTFLDAGTAPVYIGFGSMPTGAPQDIARVTIEAVRAQGRRALVSRGWAELALTDDGLDCFAVGEVNHQALFRRVAAVVHHGGAGTTTTAARAGVPQVVLPQVADQPYWADRIAGLGIGVGHDGPTPSVESLSAALGTALTPGTRARAGALAGRIRTDGVTVAAKLLCELVTGSGPASPS